MDNGQFKNGSGSGTEENGRNFDDRPPIQFVRVGMSKDGKWLFVDTVSRACLHINYVRAIDRNKIATLAQPQMPRAAARPSAPENQEPSPKGKRARKENDRSA